MAVFKVETKNKIDIDKKPRVYFTCHLEDFEKHFKKICGDIFKTHDCAIYYTENMAETIDEAEKQVDLGRNNLFVVPVTFKLLSTPSRAMDEDIPYALKARIPVLPIMMEPGLDALYSKPDRFGELQYLNPYSTDLTEISYEAKLKQYLESVLISDELAKRVRAVFDAYIFLSYRKKDRKYANELMRRIHSIPECRSIAIWFDEFLTPGESFKDNIEKKLSACNLFALLVTPQLLEKTINNRGKKQDNYVVSTELPLARKINKRKGVDLFAVEMEETDKKALAKLKIKNPVQCGDQSFYSRLSELASKVSPATEDDPERNFLIGLAYLDGIEVEVNQERGLEMILQAANGNDPDAMKKLIVMFTSGAHVKRDYNEALRWAKRLYEYYSENYGETHEDTLYSMHFLSGAYEKTGDYKTQVELLEKAYTLRCKVLGQEDPETLSSLSDLADAYRNNGDLKKCFELKNHSYESRCKILGEHHPDSLSDLNDLALTYDAMGHYSKAATILEKLYETSSALLGEYDQKVLDSLHNLAVMKIKLKQTKDAIALLERIYEYRYKELGEDDPGTVSCLHSLATAYGAFGDHQTEATLLHRVYEIRCKTLGEKHPHTLISLHNLAVAYGELRKYQQALDMLTRVYEVQCQIYGIEHPYTLKSLNNLAAAYSQVNNRKKEMELLERAYQLRCKTLGIRHPDTQKSFNELFKLYKLLGLHQKAAILRSTSGIKLQHEKQAGKRK